MFFSLHMPAAQNADWLRVIQPPIQREAEVNSQGEVTTRLQPQLRLQIGTAITSTHPHVQSKLHTKAQR